MNNEEQFAFARCRIRDSSHLVFFTGAGMSQESGIPTFRDAGGLWDNYDPELFASSFGLLASVFRRPNELASFLCDFIRPFVDSIPHEGHRAINEISKSKNTSVLTQNIDGLHHISSKLPVLELHGSIYQSKKAFSSKKKVLSQQDLFKIVEALDKNIDKIDSASILYEFVKPLVQIGIDGIWLPNITLFGQKLDEQTWERAEEIAQNCDCMIVVGTSQTVFPAANLISTATKNGTDVFTVNNFGTASEYDLIGKASEIIPSVCQ